MFMIMCIFYVSNECYPWRDFNELKNVLCKSSLLILSMNVMLFIQLQTEQPKSIQIAYTQTYNAKKPLITQLLINNIESILEIMGKRQRQRSNISKHIKSSHKKSLINRKIANTKVDKTLKNINQIISKQMDQATKNARQNPEQSKKIQLETISPEELRKLLGGSNVSQKVRTPKINLDESLILQKLIKKWNNDFTSMSRDIKLNRMQWTVKQIEKKYQAYQKIIQEQQPTNQ